VNLKVDSTWSTPRNQETCFIDIVIIMDSSLHVASFLAGASSVEYNWMTRSDILKQVKELTRSSTSQRLGLQARDVRQVDPTLAAYTDALLIIRSGTIIISASNISMIILKDRCFFIVPNGADSIITSILSVLNTNNHTKDVDELPFELRALEATLATIVQQMETELSELQTTLTNCLSKLRHSPSDPKSQTTLFLNSGKLNSFEQRANAVVDVLEDVLQQPLDMAYMSLTRLDNGMVVAPTPSSPMARPRKHLNSGKANNANINSSGQKNRASTLSSDDINISVGHDEDVELLLENYLGDCKSLSRRSKGLQAKLTSTSRIIEIELASSRNRLLRYDVALELVAVVTAICALFAGLFGMNLKSGLENSDNMFWFVFCFSLVLVVVLPFSLLLVIQKKLF